MKIRSVLESNCVVYHSMLSQEDSSDIERVQKIVFKIILGPQYTDYHLACISLNVKQLNLRRIQLCLNFGLKCLNDRKFKHLFKRNLTTSIRNSDHFYFPTARSTRYFKSPLLYITRLLNDYFSKS